MQKIYTGETLPTFCRVYVSRWELCLAQTLVKAVPVEKTVHSSTPRPKTIIYTHTTLIVIKYRHSEFFVVEGQVLRGVWFHVLTALTNARYASNSHKLAAASIHTIDPLLIPLSSGTFSSRKLSLSNESKSYSMLVLP